jgi:pimeloyl-ACP methyl ester carboxylesterase
MVKIASPQLVSCGSGVGMDETAYRREEQRLWAAVGLEPTEHWVDLTTTGTRVRVQEVGQGEPALFVHGGPSAGSEFAPMLPHIQGLRCLLLDRPGTGLSAPFGRPSREFIADLSSIGARIVGDLLDGLGLERAHVVGSSFGSHLALRSAAATPERFDRMVNLSCPAFVQGDTIPPVIRLMRFALVGRILGALPPSKRANRSLHRQLGHGKSIAAGRIPAAYEDWYLALAKHTDTMRTDGEGIGAAVPMWQDLWLTDDLLAKIGTPTLFVWGADDTFGGEDVARRLVAAMPDAKLEMLPDAGHLPWLDDAETVATAIDGFLAGRVSDLHAPS